MAFAKKMTAASLLALVAPACGRMLPMATLETLQALDTDGSGRVDRSEIEAFARSQGLNAAQALDEFLQLDRNGDGELDLQELGASFADGGADASAPVSTVPVQVATETSQQQALMMPTTIGEATDDDEDLLKGPGSLVPQRAPQPLQQSRMQQQQVQQAAQPQMQAQQQLQQAMQQLEQAEQPQALEEDTMDVDDAVQEALASQSEQGQAVAQLDDLAHQARPQPPAQPQVHAQPQVFPQRQAVTQPQTLAQPRAFPQEALDQPQPLAQPKAQQPLLASPEEDEAEEYESELPQQQGLSAQASSLAAPTSLAEPISAKKPLSPSTNASAWLEASAMGAKQLASKATAEAFAREAEKALANRQQDELDAKEFETVARNLRANATVLLQSAAFDAEQAAAIAVETVVQQNLLKVRKLELAAANAESDALKKHEKASEAMTRALRAQADISASVRRLRIAHVR